MPHRKIQPEFQESRDVGQKLTNWPNLGVLEEEEVLIVDDDKETFHIRVIGDTLTVDDSTRAIQVDLNGKTRKLEMSLVNGRMRVHEYSADMIWRSGPIQSIHLTISQEMSGAPATAGRPVGREESGVRTTIRSGIDWLLKWGRG